MQLNDYKVQTSPISAPPIILKTPEPDPRHAHGKPIGVLTLAKPVVGEERSQGAQETVAEVVWGWARAAVDGVYAQTDK